MAVGIGVNCRHHPAVTCLSGDGFCRRGRCGRSAERCLRGWPAAICGAACAVGSGRGLCRDPRRLARPRRWPRRSRCACACAEREIAGTFRGDRRGRPAAAAAATDGSLEAIAAGEVFPSGAAAHNAGSAVHGEALPDDGPERGTGFRAARRHRRDRHEPVALRLRLGASQGLACWSISVSAFAGPDIARHRPDHARHPLSRGGAAQSCSVSSSPMPMRIIMAR